MKTPRPARSARNESQQNPAASNIVVKIASILLIIWTISYGVVCFRFISRNSKKIEMLKAKNIQPEKPVENIKVPIVLSRSSSNRFNPFVSNSCEATYDKTAATSSSSSSSLVSVILTVRNEEKASLLHTVNSVLAYSGKALEELIVVDDASYAPIDTWNEWSEIRKNHPDVLIIVNRVYKHFGVAKAREHGSLLAKGKSEVLVFLDSHSIVSKNWLSPLVSTLGKYPESLVYPAIDVIDGDPLSGPMIKADEAVATFDWSFRERWEFLENNDRLPLSTSQINPDEEIFSPAAPGIFAVRKSYLKKMGNFNNGLSGYGTETIELSLRVWLCGGSVIKQPCSRVAHSYPNLNQDVANMGATLGQHDKNAMFISEHWLSPKWREVVYQSLFIGRVPYPIPLPIDSRLPTQLHKAEGVGPVRDTCQTFDWYMKEVYSGLKSDAEIVTRKFSMHINSNYLEKSLKPLLDQYDLGTGSVKPKVSQAEFVAEEAGMVFKPKFEELPVVPLVPPKIADELNENDPMKVHQKHSDMVKETLICEDEVLPGNSPVHTCSHKAMNGHCEKNIEYMLLGCPKSCNFCDSNGKLCADFFLKKCPSMKESRGCADPWMKKHCMKSCNACSDNQAANNNNNNNNNNIIVRNVMEVPGTIRVHDIEIPGKIDPTLSHRQWVEGLLPDFDPNFQNLDSCKIKNGPNGKLLSRIALSNENELNSDPSISKIRLFCGTYTMEANHMGNIQALRRTWGKRCDGWVAFSTKDDPKIPALAITHEGEESYNNMWQKSRSIWRYIGAHYMDDFDWFLLGGDDMYYIVENLRYYLGSKEIQEKSSKEPMFVGRRFFPPGQKVFNSGGAGYLLSRASLKILFDNIDTNPKCFPHQHGFWEDVNVANCLFQSAGILPYDTRDDSKRERFHPFTPGQHLEYQAPPDGNDWYVKYNPELKFGFECCSDKSISFHYAKAEVMNNLHSFLYHCSSRV